MRNYFLTFSFLVAMVGGSFAYANDNKAEMVSIKANSVSAREAENTNVGVPIGTVDAQLYEESGLDLNKFGYSRFVAKISESTFIGFDFSDSWYNSGDNNSQASVEVTTVVSTEKNITIPDSIRLSSTVYAVSAISLSYFIENDLQSVTLPQTVTTIVCGDFFTWKIHELYMLGQAPEVIAFKDPLSVDNIYICQQDCMPTYIESEYFGSQTIRPYGWDFDWIVVNVDKAGEFSNTYLSITNDDWNVGNNLKVSGSLSEYDLKAFKNIKPLMKLDLSETEITEIPYEFQVNNNQLLEVILPKTVSYIGDYAFKGCTALSTIEVTGLDSIGISAFYDCKSLSFINLEGTKKIRNNAFNNCISLDNIDLSAAAFIGPLAFANCSSIRAIDLSSAVEIGWTFEYYYGSNGSFANCSALKSVKLGNSLKCIGVDAFSNTAIESIVLPEGITCVANRTFENCRQLKNIELPSTVNAIGESAFEYCTSLPFIKLNEGVREIGTYAFSNCNSLADIILPSTLKRIHPCAFYGTNLKTIKCFATVPPAVNPNFIDDDPDLTHVTLYVPSFSKESYRSSNKWKNFYLIKSLEENVSSMDLDGRVQLTFESGESRLDSPIINLTWERYVGEDKNYWWNYLTVGQVTFDGDAPISASQFNFEAELANRYNSECQYCPTLINNLPQIRTDNVSHHLTFSNRYIGSEWYFISLPYDVKVSDIVADEETYWVVRKYDSAARAAGENSNTWVDLKDDDVMEAGKGYIISVISLLNNMNVFWNDDRVNPGLKFKSGNSLSKNNIFRNSDLTVPLTEYSSEFAHNRSWNLLGNPFPCYFDMKYLGEDFNAPITLWNGNSYIAYSPQDDDLVLSPYEAFFVQAPVNTSEMIFTKDGRMHFNDGKEKFKLKAYKHSDVLIEERNVFNFVVANSAFSDRARIVFNAEASDNYEVGRDASKFFAEAEGVQLYVSGDVNYSINERPIGDGCAVLGIRSSNIESYTLSLNGRFSPEWNVILTDNTTGVSVDLTKEDYTFNTDKTDNPKRFFINFSVGDNNQSNVEAIMEDFSQDDEVTVNSVNGTTVYNGTLSNVKVPSAGLYIISNGKVTRKVVLKKNHRQ